MVSIRDFGARGDGVSDDAPAIQRALESGNPLVHAPGGTYCIASTLYIRSGTTLHADPDAVFRLADHAPKHAGLFLLTNDDTHGDSCDITVDGGVWDGNAETNPRGDEQSRPCYTGVALNFVRTSNLTVRNLTLRNPDSFSLRLGEVDRFLIEDITLDDPVIRLNQDGVHVGGYCHNGRIEQVRAVSPLTPNDDMIALNADDDVDRVINQGLRCGPIRDIRVHNISATEAYTFVRLLSTVSPLEDISIENVHGGCRRMAINLNRWRFPPGQGGHRNISLRHFRVRKVDPDNLLPLIDVSLAPRQLHIEDFEREDDGAKAATLVVANDRTNHVTLDASSETHRLVQASSENIHASDQGTADMNSPRVTYNMDRTGAFTIPRGGFKSFELATTRTSEQHS